DQWMAMTRKHQGMSEQKFRAMIEQYGMSYADYRETIRQNLLKMRFVKTKLGSKVSISDDAILEKYREQYGPVGATEREVKVRQILVQPDGSNVEDLNAARAEAKKLVEKLDNGADFKKLAKKHSDGPSAKKGGLLGTFVRGELNPSFSDVVFNLEEGQHSGVVETKHGFHVLMVDEATERASQNVEKRKKRIRQKLRQKKLQQQLDGYVKKLRKKAFIDIKI
ncbi:MAG: peptidylprolyl isomerase, partial [Bradymonadaceae bacterium]